jgi:nucleotide-binding universal stress UspA family protein
VLCAIDLGDHSETVLRWAAEFAAKTNAALGIAHAVPAVQGMPEMYLDREFVAAIAHSARERIAALQGKLGTKAEVFVRAGDPATVVHEAAEEQQADLVVIARGAAAGGLGRLRGHDYSIIRKSPCPVVSV